MILVTRPKEDSRALVAALDALGCDSLVEPMLRIDPLADAVVDLDGCDAVLFTSANGVRCFSALTDRRDLPVLTVGDASAAAARDAGFGDVRAADGDVTALVALVREAYPIPGTVFFHAAGSQVAGDLKGDLEALGHTVRRIPLYQAIPSDTLSDACREALAQGRIFAATFFSPRTAQAFDRLLEEQGYASCARTVRAVCLSPAVADKAAKIDWAEISTAETPDMPALLERIQEAIAMTDDKKEPETEEPPTDQAEDATDAGAGEEVAGKEVAGEEAITISADAVIEAFGGIRPMAAKLDVAVSTVQGWKTRDHIPDNRWRDVITAADVHGVDLSGALSHAVADAEKPSDKHTIDLHDIDTGVYDGPIDYEPQPDGDEAEESASENTKADPADNAKPEEKAPATPKNDAAPAKSGGGGLALVVGLVALAAVVTRPAWAPYTDPHLARYFPAMQQQAATAVGTVPDAAAPAIDTAALTRLGEEVGALSDALALVKAEVGALSDRMDGMGTSTEGTDAASSMPPDLPDAVSGRLDDLAASIERDSETRQRVLDRLGVIENLLDQVSAEAEKATTAVAGMESAQADQRAELERLAARPAVEGATQAGLALGVGSVETALVAGRPFDQGLARIDSLAPETGPIRDAVEQLMPFAENGVKSRAALVTAFQAAIPAMQAEIKAQETGDVIQDVLNGLQSLVSVRRKGDDPDAPPVSRAEAALARGDLVAAVAVLTPLREASVTVAAWLDDAEARLSAEAGLAALQDGVAAGLTGLTTGQGDEGDGA
ncbi:hypothetical protein HH303_04715 [Rhodospirillaceae bacterium KN72]|uniref:Uroporphyrinogen-III synthase n=1 Tax=Pacificispira spongiicola TaxID=2729598 RepID=A0A7Y0DY79_9PROT|nr:uroporphyrinogen-III synthase [Pacificispira spongiicola]NMM43766.1 hypothetical protein [Pacificispira spongiicola]